MKVSVQYAESHIADLLQAADSGEEVEITRPDKPALFLAPRPSSVPLKRTTPRILGAGRGEMRVPFWEEWKAIDKEVEQEMCDAPFISTGEI
jgi:antitoxin (DNA-binding transcriptional repressor) of toxin-antitoxin stability system